MKRNALVAALALAFAPTAIAATPTIPYATEHVIAPGDTDAVIAEKAAKVLPRPNQSAWMRLERTFFLHFGVNTFNQVEWGSGREDPAIFNPPALDAKQWLRSVKQLDGKMLVLVAKHHDGFAMWPSRYTGHSSAASPWRGGKGDLVREVADAARADGVKLGIYLSPADLYQLRTNPVNPAGYYGNGSPKLKTTIPTDPASFKGDPSKGRAPAPGFKSYSYEVDDYNRYFLNQLYELLTQYGPVHEVWFDGANPDPSVQQAYDYGAWYDLIRKLQPDAVIMGKGPDVRWVGTESGYGRTTEWSVVPLPTAPGDFTWPDMHGDLGHRAQLTPGSHLWWYPAETNVTMLANGQWFWARDKRPRPVTQLVDIYYSSIGRNGNLILNLSPDNRGLVPDDQVQALGQMAEIVDTTFATNLAAGARVTADQAARGHGATSALDGKLDTWWEAAGRDGGALTLTMPKAVKFDVVSLQEAVDRRGQRIESFVIETWNGAAWVAAEPIASDALTTVGHRRLVRLRAPVSTDRVRVRITGARLHPTLAEVGLYLQSTDLLPPVIAERDADGKVALSHPAGGAIVYTTDGTAPRAGSPVYGAPLAVASGVVKAARVLPGGRLGVVGTRDFIGLSPRGWQVVVADGDAGNAALAIDGDPGTYWEGQWTAETKAPRAVTVDMGQRRRIAGVVYLPRQDGQLNGTVENFRFEVSEDGVRWTTAIERGTFANVRNNPDLQQARFAPVRARYFRFTALDDVWRNGWTNAAELSVIPAEGE
ncbi:alpha-L-fucosidase [Duganella sp. 1411]|uniref:alpha-L-fucosidase n=1 Tax=Duganella sp. 1411 TaxID=2806572 RepID=UPI001AE43243|nr:alpha-L-fucosidase [Duganella sp. 1411]MBP1202107.1 alpha-L-fucosidase [Duganella sp. 1411]